MELGSSINVLCDACAKEFENGDSMKRLLVGGYYFAYHAGCAPERLKLPVDAGLKYITRTNRRWDEREVEEIRDVARLSHFMHAKHKRAAAQAITRTSLLRMKSAGFFSAPSTRDLEQTIKHSAREGAYGYAQLARELVLTRKVAERDGAVVSGLERTANLLLEIALALVASANERVPPKVNLKPWFAVARPSEKRRARMQGRRAARRARQHGVQA
jgi:hypothetical protein